METEVVAVESSPATGILARRAGLSIVVLSALGVVLGLVLTESVADDARSSVAVSQSALEAMVQTVETVNGVVADTSAGLEGASASVEQVSVIVGEAVAALGSVADFLEEDLPETIETVRTAMPGAIETANVIDSTLRTLSLFGVDYDPDEPFGESLSRVNTALASLPGEIRAQSDAMRQLVPSASQLAVETEDLSRLMTGLEEGLDDLNALSDQYEATLAEAEATIIQTDSSIDSSLWMIRALVVAAGFIGLTAGAAIAGLGGRVNALAARLEDLEAAHHSDIGERPESAQSPQSVSQV